MLDISSEIVCGIIERARELHAKEQNVLPEDASNPSDDGLQILAARDDDLTFQEVKQAIDDLEQDQQTNLVALMWIGRGDYSAEEWEDALDQARQSWTPHTADYLLTTPLVADYLEDGLQSLGFSCEE